MLSGVDVFMIVSFRFSYSLAAVNQLLQLACQCSKHEQFESFTSHADGYRRQICAKSAFPMGSTRRKM